MGASCSSAAAAAAAAAVAAAAAAAAAALLLLLLLLLLELLLPPPPPTSSSGSAAASCAAACATRDRLVAARVMLCARAPCAAASRPSAPCTRASPSPSRHHGANSTSRSSRLAGRWLRKRSTMSLMLCTLRLGLVLGVPRSSAILRRVQLMCAPRHASFFLGSPTFLCLN